MSNTETTRPPIDAGRNSPQRAAIFLDRDGTIIEDRGTLSSPDHVRLFPDTARALREAADRYLLFVVTNQAGIAAGQVTWEQVNAVNDALSRRLSAEGVDIREWYVCPHQRSDNCVCIKPNPTFLKRAADAYDLDLCRSFVIGDHPHDVYTGDTVGSFGLYLLTGHGRKHLDELQPERPVFHSLHDAVRWICAHPGAAADMERSVRKAAAAVRGGGVVVFPTETVYGLGADALNERAVARLFEIKRRPLQDPLIVHIAAAADVDLTARDVPPKARLLMERFWPGPLTLVLPKSDGVPDIVTAGNPTVAVRMPSHPAALDMIRAARTPVAAPSANLFGRTSPTTARHVEEQLAGRYDAMIDAGACRVGVESTVISMVTPEPIVLRPGGATIEDIESAIGPVQVRRNVRETAVQTGGVESPGLMPSHYAPATPMTVTDNVAEYATRGDVGVLLFRETDVTFNGPMAVLSASGDLREAASNLYRAMRILDKQGLHMIVAEQLPERGLGIAVNDRLRRASRASRESSSEESI